MVELLPKPGLKNSDSVILASFKFKLEVVIRSFKGSPLFASYVARGLLEQSQTCTSRPSCPHLSSPCSIGS